MNPSRTLIYLHDGRAWVAELKDGRARLSSLVAWLSAHPGRGALRALALEPCVPAAPTTRAPHGGVASLLKRLLGRRHHPTTRTAAAG